MKTKLVLVVGLLFAISILGFSQEISVNQLKLKAAKGDIKAQYQLGLLYYEGTALEKDVDKALDFIEKSAIAKNLDAIFWMINYEKSQTETNDRIIFLWTEKAFKAGDIESCFTLSGMYRDGKGIAKNEKMAVFYCEKAASLGHEEAKKEYEKMLAEGYGNPVVLKEEQMLKDTAVVKDEYYELLSLANNCFSGKDIVVDKEKALVNYLKAAENGSEIAQVCLTFYYNGNCGVDADSEAYKYWTNILMSKNIEGYENLDFSNQSNVDLVFVKYLELSKNAAANGQNIAKLGLFTWYQLGFPFALTKDESFKLLNESAKDGEPYSKYLVANSYGNQKTTSTQNKIIINYAMDAAEYGYPEAQFLLGSFYQYGNHVAHGFYNARNWYEKAAAQNLLEAFVALGDLYSQGYEARSWYLKACDLGDIYSCEKIIEIDLYSDDTVLQNENYLFCLKTIDLGSKKAVCYKAIKQYYGLGTDQNYNEAYNGFVQALSDSIFESLFFLSEMNFEGRIVPVNFVKGLQYLEEAVKFGDDKAESKYGDMIYNEKIMDRPKEDCVEYFKLAAAKGNLFAHLQLGKFYYYGEFVEKNMEEAYLGLVRGDDLDKTGEADYLLAEIICNSNFTIGKGLTAKYASVRAISKAYKVEEAKALWDKYELSKYHEWHP